MGMVCKWLRSGVIGIKELQDLQSPPGFEPTPSLHSAWIEVLFEAEKCWFGAGVFWLATTSVFFPCG